MTIEQTWTRKGEEAQASDWHAGIRSPIGREQLANETAHYYSADLDALSAEDRDAAIEAAVDGYLASFRTRSAAT